MEIQIMNSNSIVPSSSIQEQFEEEDELEEIKIWPTSLSSDELRYVSALMIMAASYMAAGLVTIHTTELSNSVPPLVMSLFEHCLILLTAYSTTHVLLFRSRLDESAADKYNLVNSSLELFHLLVLLFFYTFATVHYFFTKISYISSTAVFVYYFCPVFTPSQYVDLLYRLLSFPSLHTYATWLRLYLLNREQTSLFLPSHCAAAPEQENRSSIFSRKQIKFAVGLMGGMLFQYCFRLNSFIEILAFLYIAVGWLANIMQLSLADDFGVLNFILGNVVLGSTVGKFGLRAHTWLAYAASLLIHCLRVELESVSFIQGRLDSRGRIICLILHIVALSGLCVLGYLRFTYSPA